jgi:hypothetical protein
MWWLLCHSLRWTNRMLTHLLLLLLLLQASLADHRVPDYVAEDPLIKVMGVTRDQVVEALQSVGFSDDLLVSEAATTFAPLQETLLNCCDYV